MKYLALFTALLGLSIGVTGTLYGVKREIDATNAEHSYQSLRAHWSAYNRTRGYIEPAFKCFDRKVILTAKELR